MASRFEPPPPYPGQDTGPSELCPNGCKTDPLSHEELEEHLLTCPLQMVECEFALAGCDRRMLRAELATHMADNAQQHLMSATLLNLRLTKELQEKMEERDRQIADMQKQLKKLTTYSVNGYAGYDIVLNDFAKLPTRGNWTSVFFSDQTEGFQFCLEVGLGPKPKKPTHLLTWLALKIPPSQSVMNVKCKVILKLLNQQADQNHYTMTSDVEFHTLDSFKENVSKQGIGYNSSERYLPLSELATREAEYLKNNQLRFKLYLKTDFFTK